MAAHANCLRRIAYRVLVGDRVISVRTGPVDRGADHAEDQALQGAGGNRLAAGTVEVFGIRRFSIGVTDPLQICEHRTCQQAARDAAGNGQR